MKNLQTPSFFENFENSQNYIFGIKKKAAFRYADRKKQESRGSNREPGTGTGQNRNRWNRNEKPNRWNRNRPDIININIK